MRTLFSMTVLLALAGCGGGSSPITDPSQLPELTEEQKQEIQRQDALIEEDEKTGGGMAP